jgi:hypothetical protein
MAGACPTEPRSPRASVCLFWIKNVFGTPEERRKRLSSVRSMLVCEIAPPLAASDWSSRCKRKTIECVAGPMIDPLTNSLFLVSMHYKTARRAISPGGLNLSSVTLNQELVAS